MIIALDGDKPQAAAHRFSLSLSHAVRWFPCHRTSNLLSRIILADIDPN